MSDADGRRVEQRATSEAQTGSAPQPREVTPQLATAGGRLGAGTWFFEPKLDGMRCLIHVEGGLVRLQSREGRPYADRLPGLTAGVRKQARADLIADGELVTFADGTTSFPHLQRMLAPRRPIETGVWLYVFDLLWLAGRDLRPLPLQERKALLDGALAFDEPLRTTPHQVAGHDRQDALLAEACARGWEGLVAKRPASPYRGGRSRAWCKLPCLSRDGFVVCGWTEGTRSGFGALLLARETSEGLRHVGRVGSGFDARHRRALEGFFAQIERPTPAVLDPPADPRGVHWVEPVLRVLVDHLGWTPGGMLRQARFISVIDDPALDSGHTGTADQPR